MKRILVDRERCLSCKACEMACAVEHHPSRSLRGVLGDARTQVNIRVRAVGHESVPLTCRHCDPSDCMDACPVDAIRREDQTGAVIIDPADCVACAMCAMACPFDAIALKVTHDSPHGGNVATKCDLCSERVKQGGQPACVEACHSHALVFEVDGFLQGRAPRTSGSFVSGQDGAPPLLLFRALHRKAVSASRTEERGPRDGVTMGDGERTTPHLKPVLLAGEPGTSKSA